MKYFLQTCHPQDFTKDAWVTVETLSRREDLEDHLQSPSFEWNHGLLVRFVDQRGLVVHQGIFGSMECVDVGPYSAVMKSTQFGVGIMRHQYGRLSFLDAYKNCIQGGWLIIALHPFMSTKTLIRFLVDQCRIMYDLTQSDVYVVHGLHNLDLWLDDKLSYEDLGFKSEPAYPLARAVYETYQSITSPNQSETVIEILSRVGESYTSDQFKKRIADDIRSMIPLYEIVIRLVP